MTEWIDELAKAFDEDPLSDDEASALLRIARDVAHRVERRETPLATFLVGMRVATRTGEGTPRTDALTQAIAEVNDMLPPSSEAP